MSERVKLLVRRNDKNYHYYCLDEDDNNIAFDDLKSHSLGEIIEEETSEGSKVFKYIEENDRSHYSNWRTIWFILHPVAELEPKSQGKTPYDFEQKLLISEINNDNTMCIKYPIIHVSMSDHYVGCLYRNEKIPIEICRNFQIMDNSIWNYLIPEKEIKYNEKRIERSSMLLRKYIENILCNYESGLYDLKVTHEYSDLNARLTSESFLKGSHAEGVSPFIFHSESALEELIKKEFFTCKNTSNLATIDLIRGQKWRILLVDDKSGTSMQNIDNSSGITKLDVLRGLLTKTFGKSFKIEDNKFSSQLLLEKSKSDANLFIEYVENLTDAKKAVEEKEYDIILLDYLLNNEYGYELLEEIYTYISSKKIIDKIEKEKIPHSIIFNNIVGNYQYEELWKYIKSNDKLIDLYNKGCDSNEDERWEKLYNEIKIKMKMNGYKIGPQKRLFFIFISAYSSAVYERLLSQGLNQSEDYWFINVGACPTNTPQLFLYNLIKLMEKRLEDSGILKLSSEEIYDLVNKIYLPKEQDSKGDSVRKRANALYQKVLSLQYHYRNILKDVEIPFGQKSSIFDTKGSVLMTDFIQKKINLGGMLEHLTQLVHLTAFGTVRQWPEMWEEYIYFKAQFEKQQTEGSDSIDSSKLDKLFSYIERYILELKSQQR